MSRVWKIGLAVVLVSATGCLFKNKRHGYIPDKPPESLPSPLKKGQVPAPPRPVDKNARNTLPDHSEYRAVPIPPPPVPAKVPAEPLLVPTSLNVSDPDEEKRLRERLREKREERREQRNAEPEKLPSAVAPKNSDAPAATALATESGVAKARRLYNMAMSRYETMTDYQAQLVRREVVGNKQMPEEEMIFQFRKKPFSVYMKVTGETGKGREVLYVDGKFDGLLHVVTGQGDNRLIGAGFKTSLKPDSSMATSKSRHKITEAGPGYLLARLGKHVQFAEAGQRTINSLGTLTLKAQPHPLEGIEIIIPPGDANLPKGGKWTLYFDTKPDSPSYGHAVTHITTDAGGRELEYYSFTNWKIPANLTDADFHPDRLGAKK